MSRHQFTGKMQQALAHYAADPDRSKSAAYKAAYDTSNMNSQTISTKAWELFQHPLMATAVQSMLATAVAKAGIDAEWVLKRAALLADFNIKKFVQIDGGGQPYYDFSEATDDDWYCIDELVVDTIGKRKFGETVEVDRIKVKTTAKAVALRLVGDHVSVQAFRENVKVDGAVALTQLDPEEFKQARREMLNDDDC